MIKQSFLFTQEKNLLFFHKIIIIHPLKNYFSILHDVLFISTEHRNMIAISYYIKNKFQRHFNQEKNHWYKCAGSQGDKLGQRRFIMNVQYKVQYIINGESI